MPVLYGRGNELGRLEAALGAAWAGSGAALLIAGEAGAGTTALLEWVAGRAGGMRILRVHGLEAESGIPFGALSFLVRPLQDLIPLVPSPGREGLDAALALSPHQPDESFAVYSGLLHLVAGAATSTPVLVLVDDLHWLDAATRSAVLFLARRVADRRVAVVLTTRPALLSQAEGIPLATLSPVDREAAARLLTEVHRGRPAEHVVDVIQAEAEGNPLALRELHPALSPRQLAGLDPLDEPTRLSDRLAQSLLRDVVGLPEATRRALVLAAVLERPEVGPLLDALEDSGSFVQALVPAEALGIVRVDEGRLQFRSALTRAAIARGQALVAASLARLVAGVSDSRKRRAADGGPLSGLTSQEMRVAQLVRHGLTNREAAMALFLTPKTVEYHLRNAFAKLGVTSRTQLAMLIANAEAEAGQLRDDPGRRALRAVGPGREGSAPADVGGTAARGRDDQAQPAEPTTRDSSARSRA